MNDPIDDGWPVGHEFTVCFKIKEKGAAGHFLHAMNKDIDVCGCEVQRIDLKDSAGQFQDKMDKLREVMLEIS